MSQTVQITSMRSTILELVKHPSLLGKDAEYSITETDSASCKKKTLLKISKYAEERFPFRIFDELSHYYLIRESKSFGKSIKKLKIYKDDITIQSLFEFLISGKLESLNQYTFGLNYYYFSDFEDHKYLSQEYRQFIVNKHHNASYVVVMRESFEELLIYKEQRGNYPLVPPKLPPENDIIFKLNIIDNEDVEQFMAHCINLHHDLIDYVIPLINRFQ